MLSRSAVWAGRRAVELERFVCRLSDVPKLPVKQLEPDGAWREMADPAKRLEDEEAALSAAVSGLAEASQGDIYLFSGGISGDAASKFTRLVRTSESPRKTATVFVTTYGGDADAAYRMARSLQNRYETFRVVIAGPCKSAGTLLAIAADELVFGNCGELGPLDVQVLKPDELVPASSGLDTMRAFDSAGEQTFRYFEYFLLSIVERSFGAISTKTAADIACRLANGVMAPVAAQLDPYRLGEIERAMVIAEAYGDRLERGNPRLLTLHNLARHYPSHSFVIDQEEAESLFHQVRGMIDEEATFAGYFDNLLLQPSAKPTIIDFQEIEETSRRQNDAKTKRKEDGNQAGAKQRTSVRRATPGSKRATKDEAGQ